MRAQVKAGILLLSLALTLFTARPLVAQQDDVAPCSKGDVSGRVTAVDQATGVITIDTGAGLCTVTLQRERDNPIVALLARFFGDVSVETLANALEAAQGCAIHDDANDTWAWSDCDAEGAVTVTVIGQNDDGTFVAVTSPGGTTINLAVADSETAEQLLAAVKRLTVKFELDKEGRLLQTIDQIAAYHDSGLGFGVLVKLYGISALSQQVCETDAANGGGPCGVTVEELVNAFRSGTGIGELFRQYGRPAILGVGHVRQEVGDMAGLEPDQAVDTVPARPPASDRGLQGICNARDRGGNAYALGHGEIHCLPQP